MKSLARVRPAKPLYLSLVYFFLYFPVIVLIIFSFNNATFSGFWQGFTWRWYQQLFHDSSLLTIALHSVIIATLASSAAVFIGTLGAIALFKYRFFGRTSLYLLIFSLIIVPDLVLAIALLLLFHEAHLSLGFTSLLLAHITFCVPFVFVTIYSRLSTLNRNLFEAAKDLGASDFIIATKIMLPLLLPALIAGWLLSFTLSLDDVMISFFVSGPSYQILPLYIFSHVRVGVTPELNALCSLILIATVIFAIIAQGCLRKKT
jgi:spermidine/putrescine transport system permease protein